jgi:hypothetical protein
VPPAYKACPRGGAVSGSSWQRQHLSLLAVSRARLGTPSRSRAGRGRTGRECGVNLVSTHPLCTVRPVHWQSFFMSGLDGHLGKTVQRALCAFVMLAVVCLGSSVSNGVITWFGTQ